MILYFTYRGIYNNIIHRSLECYNLDINKIISLLSLKDYYINFNIDYDNKKKYQHYLIQNFLSPSYFYYVKEPNYKYISIFESENINKLVKLWADRVNDFGELNLDYFLDLKQNYKKYINEAAIKEIIE